ncbi:MAG: hypothetical protein ACI8UO_000203 [Verrucomicrobiales bacterium]|jgi:hypothetical protein
MPILKIALAGFLVLLLAACGDEPKAKEKISTAPPQKNQEPVIESDSLFAPLNPEHAKNMIERKDELAEVERQGEIAAKKREAEFLKEVEDQLATLRTDYVKIYNEQIGARVASMEKQLGEQFLFTVKPAETSNRKANRIVLADQLAVDIGLVEAGNRPPAPPPESDTSNPGLKPLFDMRRWYQEGYANIQAATKSSEAELTGQYRLQLQQYFDSVKTASPPEAAKLVAAELETIKGEWWKEKSAPAED